MTSTPGGDESGLERRFEHITRHPRVLADEHAPAAGREHARGRAREAQCEIDGHRAVPDAAAHTVGAEISLCHSSAPCITALAIQIASRVGPASCVRMIFAPSAHGERRQSEAAVEPIADVPAKHAADQVLARDTDEQRAPERRQPRQFAQQRQIVREPLAESDPRIEHDRPLIDAGREAQAPLGVEEPAKPPQPRRRSAGPPASCAARPACASGKRRPRRRRPNSARRARAAHSTSLTIEAPAPTAAAMTSGLLVSTDTATSNRDAMRSITGTTRSISTAASTADAPGRVDSPPTSMIEAPSAMSAAARSIAAPPCA